MAATFDTRFRSRIALAIVVVLTACLFASGSARAASAGGVTPGTGPSSPSGGTGTSAPAIKRKKRARVKRKIAPPVITGFALGADTLFDQGQPLTLRYRIKASVKHVRVKLVLRTQSGQYVRTLQLGVHSTKVLQTTQLTQQELTVSRIGSYKLRLTAIDGKGRHAARAANVDPWLAFSFADHRFPVVGKFTFGGPDAKFGAGRPGHIHQGQDVVAAAGTPVVAPHTGTVEWVQYQAGGAGWYVVLSSAGEDYDYAFMHLEAGSIDVKQGEVVPTGKLLGLVGMTGDASGPHLHFEVWTGGPWQMGGHPVDPLPFLQAWYATAPGGAQQIG